MATNAATDKSTDRESEMTTMFGLRIPTEQIWKVAVGIAAAALAVFDELGFSSSHRPAGSSPSRARTG
jgi:hypothetical protein